MYKDLETERLLIRPIRNTDAQFITELVNSEGWLNYIGNRPIYNNSDAENYIENILGNPSFYYSVFELKSTRQPVGIVTFLHRQDQKFPDLGFALLPLYENNGYALEACKNYLDELIASHRYSKIIAITSPDNKKSIGLLKKLGLKFEADGLGDQGALSVYGLSI